MLFKIGYRGRNDIELYVYDCTTLYVSVFMSRVVRNVSESFLYWLRWQKQFVEFIQRWLSRVVHAIRSTIRWLAECVLGCDDFCYLLPVEALRRLPIVTISIVSQYDRYHECMSFIF